MTFELNGETDDEDMEDGETALDGGSGQVRNTHDAGPSADECREHVTTHRPYRSWCDFCVMGRGVNSPHTKSDAQEDLEKQCSMCRRITSSLAREKSEEQVTPMLVIRERRRKMTWAMQVPRKGTEFSRFGREQRSSLTSLAGCTLTRQRTGGRRVGEGHRTGSSGEKPDRSGETASGRKPVQPSHRAHGGTRGRPGQNTAGCAGASHWRQMPARCEDTVLAGGVRNRCDIGSAGKTPLHRLHGRRDNAPILELREKVLYMPAKPASGGKWNVGTATRSWSCRWLVRSSGCHRARVVDQDPCRQHQVDSRAGVIGCGPNARNASSSSVSEGRDNAFDVQVSLMTKPLLGQNFEQLMKITVHEFVGHHLKREGSSGARLVNSP